MSRLDHLEILKLYQSWRTGKDERLLAEMPFSPGELTKAVDACIKEIELARAGK